MPDSRRHVAHGRRAPAFSVGRRQAIICQGGVEVYAPRGTYQLVIQRVQTQGLGQFAVGLPALHKRLASEGLFDPNRKRALPRFPLRVGFVTSPAVRHP